MKKWTILWRVLLLGLAVYFLFFSGCKEAAVNEKPAISSITINASQLPNLDPTRTYHFRTNQIKPEEMLLSLLQAGIPVQQAWLPLDNFCLDPIGPRFTVQLSRPDSKIETFGFDQGEGRLACSSQLKQYVLSP